MIVNEFYYCYSRRLSHFIRAFNIDVIKKGMNLNTGAWYYQFRKSDKLDAVLRLWNEVKATMDDYDVTVSSYVNSRLPPSEKEAK